MCYPQCIVLCATHITLLYWLPTYCKARKLFDNNRMRWSAVELEVAHCRSRARQSALLWAPHHTTCVTTQHYYINHNTLLYQPHHTTCLCHATVLALTTGHHTTLHTTLHYLGTHYTTCLHNTEPHCSTPVFLGPTLLRRIAHF